MSYTANSVRRFPRQVLFAGYYGHQNTGDDAFTVVADRLAAHWGVDGRLLARQRDLSASLIHSKGALPNNIRVRGMTRAHSVLALARANALVYLGGSIFMVPSRQLWDQTTARRAFGVPAIAVGVSIGPCQDRKAAESMASMLQDVAFVSVRDTASADRLVEMGYRGALHNGFDPAIALRRIYGMRAPTRSRRQRTVTVVPAAAARAESSEEVRLHHVRLADGLRRLIEDGLYVRLLVFSRQRNRNDASAVEFIRTRLTDLDVEAIPYTGSVLDQWGLIRGSDYVIAERLHAAIFSYAAEVPFLLVAYERKSHDFADRIRLPLEQRIWRGDRGIVEMVSALAQDGTSATGRLLHPDEALEAFDAAVDQVPQRLAQSK